MRKKERKSAKEGRKKKRRNSLTKMKKDEDRSKEDKEITSVEC